MRGLRLVSALAAFFGTLLVAVLLPLSSGDATSSSSNNLFQGDTASFDGGTGTWLAYTSKVSLGTVPSPTQAGTGALLVRNDTGAASDEWIGSGSGPGGGWIPAVPDATYTASVFARAESTGRLVQPALAFYNSSGAQLGSVFGQTVTDTNATWSQTRSVVGLAPSGTAYVLMIVVVYGTSAGETHYLDSASLTETKGSPTAIATPLHTAGNQILDAQAHPVVLRGVQAERAEFSTGEVPTDSYIAGIRRWRANFVRVPLNESLWLNTCPTTPSNDPNYPAAVDAAVQSITSRNMVAMLTLTSNALAPCATAKPNSMADASYSIPFWQQLAARYKSNGLVVFDLYNEPHDISDSTWLLGGQVTQGTTTYQAAGMQQMYDAVRAQGADNLVFVAGNNWASSPSSTHVAGDNIVNSVHAYTCPQHPPPGCPFSNVYDPSQILDRWVSTGSTSPVMVTEFGWPDHNDGIYDENVIAYAEKQAWGWNAFAWVATSGPFNLNADSGPAFEPTPAGQSVLTGLAQN